MIDQEQLVDHSEIYLKSVIASVSGVPEYKLDIHTPFQELGIDSFHALKIVKMLEHDFGTLPKTLLFENFNIADLARYLVEKFEANISEKCTSSMAAYPESKEAKNSFSDGGQLERIFQKSPIIIHSRDLPNSLEDQQLVNKLYEQYKTESTVSRGTKNIAPYLYIGSDKKGYFNLGFNGKIVLAYSYTGPEIYFDTLASELYGYCAEHSLDLVILSDLQLQEVGGVHYTATPFGAIQRIVDLDQFTLDGKKMRRLRYQVSKFEKSGECKLIEHWCGNDTGVDENIVAVIDRWCEGKTMVNPLVGIARDEIKRGTFSKEHRIFLTYVDEDLQNIIIISPYASGDGGYLMDLEFYPPEMPLGGLEYAIVGIINILISEGCRVLSLGATLGPKLAPSENADPDLDAALDAMRERQIFNDQGNLQFKNKFRPENGTIFLCKPAGSGKADDVTDIIMMIADPDVNQPKLPLDTKALVLEEASQNNSAIANDNPVVNANISPLESQSLSEVNRSDLLAEYLFDIQQLPERYIDWDLQTDSWAKLDGPYIKNQKRYFYENINVSINFDEAVKKIFPHQYFALADSGRSIERVFYKAFSKKGVVPQNLLFPTTIFHQIDNGFEPIEIPNKKIFDLASKEDCKGEIDLDALRDWLDRDSQKIAFVCVELANNASGGCPLSLSHLRAIKAMLEPVSIPFVLDATRILENAHYEVQQNHSALPLWEVTREMLSCADVVIVSLTKDFGVTKGGIVLSNDLSFIKKIKEIIICEGIGVDTFDRKMIALSFNNPKRLTYQTSARIKIARKFHALLKQKGVPTVEPVLAHCVLINVAGIRNFSELENAVASFVAWLYLTTGIRAAEHNVGMQKGTTINGLVRLAIPLGMGESAIEIIAEKIGLAFSSFHNIPDLELMKIEQNAYGEYVKHYKLKQYRNPLVIQAEAHIREDLDPSRQSENIDSSAVFEGCFPQAAAVSSSINGSDSSAETQGALEIAIVGVAGRYPKAKNMFELWSNLIDGRDCIDEISAERLNKRWQKGFAEKYRGGFIDDVDKFDSLFFNISPREAEMLDPQERLFLETAWEALEDAGYYPESVCGENKIRDVGVFVGAVWAMYQIIGVEEKINGKDTVPNSFFWSIANRVSYWMDFSGPSLTLDTACSSSLTALHLACESIYKGECSVALVGGVNLDLHQRKLDINTAGGTQSVDGVCRSFGKGANGYVAGEGVGVILLKPLNKAIKDNDNIYGVIKSAVVNHGGKTSGYAVPSPKAQANVIQAALDKANIDARTIGYIEAHGTGTELGDPIEIDGLTRAFAHWNADKQSCAIGSIKSNIGHLEATAGIVGVCKTLLQMRHRMLVPSLHSEELNEHIDFPATPFYVVQRLQSWRGKEIDGVQYPLRAGVSSFGAGGSNAHVILEEFKTDPSDDIEGEQIVPLSARTESQLREMARALQIHLQSSINTGESEVKFADVVFTLQSGRKPFNHRLVVLADSLEMLTSELAAYEQGASSERLMIGSTSESEGLTKLLSKSEKREFVNLLLQQRDTRRLAQLWVEGLLNDWQGLPDKTNGKRISLPTYPFADKRHWACDERTAINLSPLLSKGQHPLIDSNESTFEKQLFKKTFSESDFFIYDHVVSGIPTLPGVAYLELARKAGELAAGRRVRKIINIVWVSPLTVEHGKNTEAYVELKPSGEFVHFEVYSEDTTTGSKRIYAQGKLAYYTQEEARVQDEYIDIGEIQSRCKPVNSGATVYPLFDELGLNLGESFQVLGDIHRSEYEVLGALNIPQHLASNFDDFVLHPSLVDGSFQAGMGAALSEKAGEMFVPYSIGEVEVLWPLEKNCFSYITEGKEDRKGKTNLARSNVYIVNTEGKVLVKIKDSVGVPLVSVHEKPVSEESAGQDEVSKLYYADYWYEKSASVQENVSTNDRVILIFDNSSDIKNAWQDQLAQSEENHRVIQVKSGEKYRRIDETVYSLNPGRIEDYKELFSSLCNNANCQIDVCFAWTSQEVLTEYCKKDISHILQKGVFAFTKLYQALIELNLEKRTNTVYFYHADLNKLHAFNSAMSAFVRTLKIEHPKATCKLVEYTDGECSDQNLARIVNAELRYINSSDVHVRYNNDVRLVSGLEKIELDFNSEDFQRYLPVMGGVYLITGGAGGLGLIFAEFLVKEYKATVILTGRSQVSTPIETKLVELNNNDGLVDYVPADITRLKDVRKLIDNIKSNYGKLNGVIHGAGVLRDALIRNKTVNEMQEVFAPKIYGICVLDEVTKKEKLDFFVMFSSMAGIAGNVGQVDYAFANHFMDVFAHERQQRVNSGHRYGKTLSLNWSIWAEGGMQLDEQTEIFFRNNLGIEPIGRETGTEALIKGLASDLTQFAVIEGVQRKVEQAWGITKTTGIGSVEENVSIESDAAKLVIATSDALDAGELVSLVQEALSQLVIDFLKLDADDISLDKILLEVGFDSITLATFANLINDKYSLDLTPVVFFEYQSIREVANHLVEEFTEIVQQAHGVGEEVGFKHSGSEAASQGFSAVEESRSNVVPLKKGWWPGETLGVTGVPSADHKTFVENRFVQMPIAIVGIGGVMPLSDNLEEFWENLKNEKNLISVIPENRWRWQDYDGDPLKEQNKSNSKWGGFLREVDKFDPLFFGISPKEAELMDPQQRIFLQTVWQAVEDSGQKVSDLAGTKTGLFVGVATNDYLDTLSQHHIPVHAYTSTGNSHSILANRVSFLLDIHGPSAPLDTACSSSLVATHRALESLHSGSCEMAIVGGVQVMTSPGGYIAFGQAGMLSSDGKCKTFDKRANGYVRGEGAGAIFLKPLSKAEADGNPIYALIKSTAENHGGSAAALTAPNPTVQAELLVEAYEKAQIDPTTVGFIECHGTGTSLGDPIEIQALKKAFGELYKKHNKPKPTTPHCGLSSVKTNIGHLETAAGIAGILKAVLAIKNKAIPALIHFEELNPYIDLKGSPFYIVNKTTPWRAPESDEGDVLPRRAGISSFGFGGAYAHVVLEEYRVSVESASTQEDGNHIIILSAKNEKRLTDYARILLEHLQKKDLKIAQVAYTLQVGRDEMDHRLALVVRNMDELKARLTDFVIHAKQDGLFLQKVDKKKLKETASSVGDSDQVEVLIQNRHFEELARLWVQGVKVSWQKIYKSPYPRRLSLPTYPFARESYWVPQVGAEDISKIPVALETSVLHPLVHRNTSSLTQQKFQSQFSGTEFYFSDHVVDTQKILPGVAYMEMARVAAEYSFDAKVRYIRNLVWKRPIIVDDEPKSVEILLTPQGESVEFTVQTLGKDFTTTNCSGILSYWESKIEPQFLDVESIRTRCSEVVITATDLYQKLFDIGLRLGKSFQIVEKIFATESESLAVLRLPEHLQKHAARYVLHPALMDGSLHTAVGLMLKSSMDVPLSLPYSVGEIEVLDTLKDLHYGYATWAGDGEVDENGLIKANVHLLDKNGKLLVSIRDFMSKPLVNIDRGHSGVQGQPLSQARAVGVKHYINEWKQNPGVEVSSDHVPQSILIFDNSEAISEDIHRFAEQQWQVPTKIIRVQTGRDFVNHTDGIFSVNPEKPEQYDTLLQVLSDEGEVPDAIIYNWSIGQISEDCDMLKAALGSSIFSLHYLCQALIRALKLSDEKVVLRRLIRLISVYTISSSAPKPHNAALAAYLKSVVAEYSRITFKVIEIMNDEDHHRYGNKSARIILNELLGDDQFNSLIRYRENKRFLKQIEKIDLPDANQSPIKNNGTYLITGGMGGLGLIFAKYLGQQANANIVLIGRSNLDETKHELLKSLQQDGHTAEYIVADVSDREDVENLVSNVKNRFGVINGIIHAAGVVRDALVVNKSFDEMNEVFSAKLGGTLNLDLATQNEPLDFFAVFSSIAGVLGNAGQSDYAYSNAFMDEYIDYRNSLKDVGRRKGLSIAFNWPLWKEGGMQIDDALQEIMQKTTGLIPLSTATGIEVFSAALHKGLTNILVFEGDSSKIESVIHEKFGSRNALDSAAIGKENRLENVGASSTNNINVSSESGSAIERSELLLGLLKEDLFKLVNSTLGIKKENFDQDIDMIEYGLDSISLSKFFSDVNNQYKVDLTPATFFEYPTFNAISQHIASEFTDEIERYFDDKIQASTSISDPIAVPIEQIKNSALERVTLPQKWRVQGGSAQADLANANEPIVVVGLGCVMPQSRNADEFWSNLLNERNLISEIPTDRWDWREFEGDPVGGVNKTNSRWGGFMPDVDKFDATFFGISPFEAELMDPQQRIFLQTVWHTIEDAGHAVSDLSGTRTGIFVGVGGHDYLEVLRESQTNIVAYASTGNTHSVLANRISYLLNLHGPSEPVDTACSASLVALNRAVEAIRTGSCEMAIAGGVNVILSPGLYLAFGNAGMLASDGKCKTFDKRADGYVRGEGAGAVFLKKLTSALRDRNHIYGVVKSTGVNHGGHATALTAPNPNAQAELIIDTYRKAGIDLNTVSYIEAHGTGTSLGDPVEINGLKKAFKELAREQNTVRHSSYCGLGSVKTNIGHLETAAGIASFIKVLLALKYEKLPATLHQNELNPHIRLEGSPFYIVNKTLDWRSEKNTHGTTLPRRAGISSFGFGGANAHVVVEEYLDSEPANFGSNGNDEKLYIVPVSARTEEGLTDIAKELLHKLQTSNLAVSMESLAFTLQVGRDAREFRMALVTSSLKELCSLLKFYVDKQEEIEGVYIGSLHLKHKEASIVSLDKDIKETIVNKLIGEKRLQKLASLWVQGLEIDWHLLYPKHKPKRISLPGYPFAKTRHWIMKSRTFGLASQTELSHPLVHLNSSNIEITRFTSRFSGKESFLIETQADCDQKGAEDTVCFPHMLTLEMGLRAVRQASILDNKMYDLQVHNVLWYGSHKIDKNSDTNIELFANGDTFDPYRQIDFDIVIRQQGRQKRFCEGQAIYVDKESEQFVDVNSLINNLSEEHLDTKLIFSSIEKLGINFSEEVYGILDVYRGSEQLLVRMRIPDAETGGRELFDFPPSVLEGITKSCFLQKRIDLDSDIAKKLFPVSLQSLSVRHVLTQEIYLWVSAIDSDTGKTTDTKYFDIVVLDKEGRCCAQLRGLSFDTENTNDNSSEAVKTEVIDPDREVVTLCTPVWNVVKPKVTLSDKDSQKVLLINASEQLSSIFKSVFRSLKQVTLNVEDGIEDIHQKINKYNFDRIVWLAPNFTIESLSDENIILQQDGGIHQVLKLVKALVKAGYDRDSLTLDLISTNSLKISNSDNVNPTHACLNGFIGALSGEFPTWQANLFDCDVINEEVVESISNIQIGSGVVYARRQGEWFYQSLAEIEDLPDDGDIYVRNGVYVVVGGSGGLGELWSRFVVDNYHARIVWIGRRPADTDVNNKLASFNSSVEYIQADASNFDELSAAWKRIKGKYKKINGVIHSAVGIFDESIRAVSEEKFREIMSVKIDVSVRIAQVVQQENLDFVLFFSSGASLSRSAGMSGYSAGCSFKDVFSNQLAQLWSCKVKVINWGYWAIGTGEALSDLMKSVVYKSGQRPLDPEEGMYYLKLFLASNLSQIVVVRTLYANKSNIGLTNTKIKIYKQSFSIPEHRNLGSLLKTLDVPPASHSSRDNGRPDIEGILYGILFETICSIDQKKIIPQYKNWLEESNDLIEQFRSTNSFARKKLDHLWKQWDALKKNWLSCEVKGPIYLLIEKCLRTLPEVLTGKIKASNIVSDNPSPTIIDEFFNRTLARACSSILVASLNEIIKDILDSNPNEKIRILEIGEGTGATSGGVLDMLNEFYSNMDEYLYTDISEPFLVHAQKTFGKRFPFLRTSILNIEKPLSEQSINIDDYHVVIVSNVAARNIGIILRNAKTILKKGGYLLLNEASNKSIYAHLIFGLTNDGWLIEHNSIRIKGSPALCPENWHWVLDKEGFNQIEFPFSETHKCGQRIIVSVSDGVVKSEAVSAQDAIDSDSNMSASSLLLEI